MSNFIRQAKNPSIFGLFKVAAGDFDKEGRALAALLEDPEANKQMLDPYAVKTDTYAQEVKESSGVSVENKKVFKGRSQQSGLGAHRKKNGVSPATNLKSRNS